MADAMVERRPSARFFCHRCNIEFEDVLQDYVCPYCASGFIEQLESESEAPTLSGDDDDGDDDMLPRPGGLADLAFLMSGGRGNRNPGRPDTLLEQLVWTLGAGAGAMGAGAVNAGAPFVLVGAPGDYVFGGEGLDAVVTQLLGQLENSGPPPMPRDLIDALPAETVGAEHTGANTCSVCWDNFTTGETISRLECDHIFHRSCIEPWLRQHATCPICRRSLLPVSATPSVVSTAASQSTGDTMPVSNTTSNRSLPRVLLRRLPRRVAGAQPMQTWDSPPDSSSSSTASPASSVTAGTGGVWAPSRSASSLGTNSSSSLNSSNDRERQYNMDIDFD